MLRESINEVNIEGILYEVNLRKEKDKNNRDYIGGSISLLVPQTINGVEDEDIIPIQFFSYKKKKDGGDNKFYDNLEKFLTEYKSIASLGGDNAAKEQADRYTVSKAKLAVNEFFGKDESIIKNPIIRGTFLNKKTKNFSPDSSFETEIMIKKIYPELNKDGEETGRLLIDGIIIQYDGKPDILTFVVGDKNAIDYINTYWNPETTVKVEGSIRFTVEQVTTESTEEVGFGTPKKKTFNKTIKEFVITSGSAEAYPEESAFSLDEVIQALAKKKEEQEKTMKSTKLTANSSADRGF